MAKKNRINLSFVGENIKKIRQVKKLSQADYSKILNMARANVGAYEEGRSEPKIETLIGIANYFGISIDGLLTQRLTTSDILKFESLNQKLDQVHKLTSSDIGLGRSVKLVRATDHLDFALQFDNSSYLKGLENTPIPSHIENPDFAIEMEGNGLLVDNQGIRHGDLLYVKKLQKDELESSLKKLVVVLTESSLFIRQLDQIEDKTLSLSALDPNYPMIQVKKSEVKQCMTILGFFSTYLPQPTSTEDRLQKIEEALQKLSGN